MIQATSDSRAMPRPLRASRRALLVEDEALVAMLAEDSLRDLGFEPLWVTSAAEAMQLLRSDAGPVPVLAVIDVGLPDMRGDDLAQHIRRAHPGLGIILATGHEVGALRARFAGDNRTVVLGKPYLHAELEFSAQAVTAD